MVNNGHIKLINGHIKLYNYTTKLNYTTKFECHQFFSITNVCNSISCITTYKMFLCYSHKKFMYSCNIWIKINQYWGPHKLFSFGRERKNCQIWNQALHKITICWANVLLTLLNPSFHGCVPKISSISFNISLEPDPMSHSKCRGRRTGRNSIIFGNCKAVITFLNGTTKYQKRTK